jgi:ABC-2 type transport system permease protein
VLVLLVLNVGMTGTALHCASDAELGTARLLVLAPVSPWALVTGRLFGGMLASLAIFIPVIGISMAIQVLTVPANHWPALIALFLAIALCASGLGAALGTVLRGGRNVAMASTILVTYLFLMGGGFTTIAFLPRWLRVLSAFDPMRYAIDGLREALFYPNLTGFTTNLAVLTGTAAASVLLGVVMVVRSWKR